MIVVASALVASAAHAQNVRFWLSYQDANSAALNGKSVGDELRDVTAVAGLTSMKVGIMATALADATYGAGGIMMTFDTVNTNGTGKYSNKAAWDAATTDKILNMDSLTPISWTPPSNLPGVDSEGSYCEVDLISFGSESFSGTAGAGTGLRGGGVWTQFGFGTGCSFKVASAKTYLLYTAQLSIDQARLNLLPNRKYSGLGLFSMQDAPSRSTYLGSTTGTGQGTSKYYSVYIMPEPSSVFAVAAGLFALIARRRK
ncbi:MAG: PEP-CTERM sorting domain-containing protein, partial [Chthonomonas sp.]|nr:PEP-CTERM sorting domain-containing protein [Chthonomonas sp.]